MAKYKHQKGSSLPKLGYYTFQSLQDRGEIGIRFVFVKNKNRPGIYIFNGIKGDIANYSSELNSEKFTDSDLNRKVFPI